MIIVKGDIMDNIFEIGKSYKSTTINGNKVKYTVMERNDNMITLKEQVLNEDNGDIDKEFNKYKIEIESGIEKILIWEDRGYESYIYANEYI
jgi:hypothetical protein